VEVDVIAKDKHGDPVRGLEAKDFTLLDDGHEQKITRLSVGGSSDPAGGAPVSEPKAPPSPTTFSNTHPENLAATVILFDVLNTAAEDQLAMKKELLRSLSRLQDGTPVALLILGENLTVVSDFTTSTISLRSAAGSQFDLRPEGFGPPITVRATGNPTLDAMILKAATRAFRAEDQTRMASTIAALNLICRQLARIRGRKSLLWITGGLDVSSDSRAVQDVIDRLNDANVAVYTVDARGVLLDPGIGADNDSTNLTGPLLEQREDVRNDVLATAAASTGGVFFHNTNRLDGAISQALADRRLVYVLEYYPQHGDWQGKLHKLEVKTSRPGVRLRYRASYRATLPAQPNAQEQQQMLAAIASSPLDFSGIRFSVEVQPGKATDPHFVLHVPVEEVQWSSENEKMLAGLQVWFIQKRASGADVVTSNWKSNLRMPMNAYQVATRQGLVLAADLKVQPPASRIRVLLRDVNSGKIGTVDVPVDTKPALQPAH